MLVCCLLLGIVLPAASLTSCSSVQTQPPYEQLMQQARTSRWDTLSQQAQLLHFARAFIGQAYVGGSLEGDGPEQLRYRFDGFDCVTLVETAWALQRHLHNHFLDHDQQPDSSLLDQDAFRQQLVHLRYRNALLEDYTSRLHYTSDWIADKLRHNYAEVLVLPGLSQTFRPDVWFMSKHSDKYPALKAQPAFIPIMAAHEARIRETLSFAYIPKQHVPQTVGSIQAGDILCITTHLPGLDFSHMGIATAGPDGTLRMLHASSAQKAVVETQQSLKDYLADISHHTGIVVLRLR